MNKRCSRCKMDKPTSEFYTWKDGRIDTRCIKCHAERYKERAVYFHEREAQRRDYYKERDAQVYRKKYREARRRIKELGNGKYWKMIVDHYSPSGTCPACGEIKKLVIDHVIPIYHGGPIGFNNVQPICTECNAHKGLKIIDYRSDHGDFACIVETIAAATCRNSKSVYLNMEID